MVSKVASVCQGTRSHRKKRKIRLECGDSHARSQQFSLFGSVPGQIPGKKVFDNLSSRLQAVVKRVRGTGRLTDENIGDAVRDVRRALIEADVALPVVRDFVEKVRARAVGTDVSLSLGPGQVFVKILHEELSATLGEGSTALDLRHQPPVIILLAGLQGAGKTTTAAKLAVHLQGSDNRKVLLASLDTRRPAAILQLEQLAKKADAGFVSTDPESSVVSIAQNAVAEARGRQADVLILDTAGRTRLDEELLDELRDLHAKVGPHETLFVVDSMAGQDAVNVAAAFGEALPLTGVILTKADGDARGGAALSVKAVTGKPIKFLGVGEDISGLEVFHPDRMASRILGMGDVMTLIEEIEQKSDHKKAEKLAQKVKKGRGFDLTDLRDQLEQMANMGGMENLLEKLPLPGNVNPGKLAEQIDSRAISRQVAIINSMTLKERKFPKVINGSRKRRIAVGSGQAVQDVNRLLKQHTQMQKMMKRFSKGGMKRMMKGIPGL
jgi:signal recognition particle subunit SRP54